MAFDATEVIIGASGHVHAGPLTSDAPADEAAVLDTDFHELGYVTEEGATFTQTREIADIMAWQSFEPVRRIVNSRTTVISFGLRQWNSDTLPFALGGGTVAAGHYEPPDPGTMDERSLILEWEDGALDYRLYIPRGLVTSAASFNLRRTDNAALPVEFSVLANTDAGKIGGKPYKLFSNDPALGGS
jgi:hypothetical protein